MSAVEKTVDKVLKLLAKAETTTPEEAEALVAKATELMVRAEIDEAMLAQAQGRQVDEIIEKSIIFKGTYADAQRDLFFAIGNATGFKQMQTNYGSSQRRGAWVGFKSDLEQAEVLLTSLLIQQTRAATSYFKANPHPAWSTAFDKFVAKRSHMMGFASGVQSLMQERRRETVKRVEQEHAAACPEPTGESSSVALVLRSKQEQVNDWYDTRYGHLKAGRSRRLAGSGDARSAGHQAGKRADLGSNRIGARKAIGR